MGAIVRPADGRSGISVGVKGMQDGCSIREQAQNSSAAARYWPAGGAQWIVMGQICMKVGTSQT